MQLTPANFKLMQQAALLNPEEVPLPYRKMLGLSGFDAIRAFSEHLGGMTIYVPSTRTIFSHCIAAEAKKEYNGRNLPELAKKYGYTERHVRKMIRHY